MERFRRQHGVAHRDELVADGLSRAAIASRLRRQQLHRVGRLVYALSPAPLTRLGLFLAGTLSFEPDGQLAGRAACEVRGLLAPGQPVEVLAPRGAKPLDGLVLHTSRRPLPPCELIAGIRVTSLSQTLLDLADHHPKVAKAVAERVEARRLHAPALVVPGRRLPPRPSELVPFTRLELEQAARELVARSDLPRPAHNLWVVGAERDLVWWDARLLVELDGDEHHRTAAQRAEDRARDRRAVLAGWTVLRFGWWDVTTHADRTLDEIRRALVTDLGRMDRDP